MKHSGKQSDHAPIADQKRLEELIAKIESTTRVAIDTEADSLHCYREKLCLVQISIPDGDYIVDPLAQMDLAPLARALTSKRIVVHGADFDLRLLRRALGFNAERIFDTVIAARILGIREFSLAALVKRFFDVELSKGSQKANWARRPLSQRMVEYAVNDTHYLLPLSEKMRDLLKEAGRIDWFRQSCQRAIEQASVDRTRDVEEAWRLSGSGRMRGLAAALLRELWHWREAEAEAVDRPSFHILQNRDLIISAEKFAAGETPDFRHFSPRRRQAFRDAAERALQMPEDQWPKAVRRFGTRPTPQVVRRSEELKRRRDRVTGELGLEPAFVAPRSTLEAIAANEESAETLLVPWQRELLELSG